MYPWHRETLEELLAYALCLCFLPGICLTFHQAALSLLSFTERGFKPPFARAQPLTPPYANRANALVVRHLYGAGTARCGPAAVTTRC